MPEQYSVHRAARFIAGAIRLTTTPRVVTDISTYGAQGIILLANGQQFSFTVAELTPDQAAELTRDWPEQE